MRVVSAPGVDELVRQRGGRLFVWTELQRCCQPSVYLRAAFAPAPGRSFRRAEGTDGFELWFDPGRRTPPTELHLDVRGRVVRRVRAYWNGCVFVT